MSTRFRCFPNMGSNGTYFCTNKRTLRHLCLSACNRYLQSATRVSKGSLMRTMHHWPQLHEPKEKRVIVDGIPMVESSDGKRVVDILCKPCHSNNLREGISLARIRLCRFGPTVQAVMGPGRLPPLGSTCTSTNLRPRHTGQNDSSLLKEIDLKRSASNYQQTFGEIAGAGKYVNPGMSR